MGKRRGSGVPLHKLTPNLGDLGSWPTFHGKILHTTAVQLLRQQAARDSDDFLRAANMSCSIAQCQKEGLPLLPRTQFGFRRQAGNCRSRASRDITNEGQIFVPPGTRFSVVHIHDCYQAVSLNHRNIHKRSRGGTLKHRGCHGGSLVLPHVRYRDELTLLEAIYEGAIVTKLKNTCQGCNAGCRPVSRDMQSLDFRIDGRIAYPLTLSARPRISEAA